MAKNSTIEVEELTKAYGETIAVDRISFNVASGETLGLIGTSGCGKTTTLKMLNRLIEPTSGRVWVNGEDIRQVKPEILRRGMGYAIQNTGLFPHYTVLENVAVVPRLLGWQESRIQNRVHELLERVGLAPQYFLHRYPRELSGGQQQRVGIARALAADPPIILLDEPFGALDQITRRQIQQDFKHLESLLHKTIVLVTHDVFEAVVLCDRLCLMDKGTVQQIGTPKELVYQPANDFVRQFFQAQRFQLELQVTRLADLLPFLIQQETNGMKPKAFESHRPLLEVLEALEQDDCVRVCITDATGEPILKTSREALLAAFYQMKEQKR